MKKLSRIVTLFLALALVLSVSAVAQPETSNGNDFRECVVKINVDLTPFVEWTYPSEIVINVPETGDPVLAQSYAIVVSDALIKKGQSVSFSLDNLSSTQTVLFSDAPLTSAEFELAAAESGASYFADDDSINGLMDSGWTIPVTLKESNTNSGWKGTNGHVIADGAASGYEALDKLIFCVVFSGGDL